MKRFFLAALAALLLFSGCSQQRKQSSNPVTFYYLEHEYHYGQSGSVIATEEREAAENRRNLVYLMALYLIGPVEEGHVSPLPRGTRIQCTFREKGKIQLELSEAARSLTDAEFSLACACLSLTCFDITGAEEVTIINGERQVAMKPQSLTLFDDSASYPTMEETQ